jgi:hypothetical protein
MLSQIATASIKGRVTAGTGNVEDLTGTQATTLLDNFTSSLKGLAPASGGGTTNFLRADGTWGVPAGTGVTGSGTTNYVPKFTSSTAIGNSQIFDDGTNVGIGTTSPGTYKLNVNGLSNFEGQININAILGNAIQFRFSTSPFIQLYQNSTLYGFYNNGRVANDLTIDNTTGYINATTRLGINLGFGGNPNAALSVNGTTLINTNTDNGVDKLQVSGSGLVTGNFVAASTSGNVSLRNTATTYPVNITTGATSGIGMYQDAGTAVIIGTNAAVTAMSPISIRGTTVDLDGNLKVNAAGRVLIGNPTPNDITGEAVQVNGAIICDQFKIWGLNTAPASASATGTLGEIRIDANYIYICTATNTWKRVAIATW